jgi:predicted MPP superfamily phosphohydrolase
MKRSCLFAALTILTAATAAWGCAGVVTGAAPPSDPLRIVLLADMNSSYGSTEYEPEVPLTISRITGDWRPDLVLIAGDMIAGQAPALPDEGVRVMWAAFDSVAAAPLREAGIPLVVTMGNHDASGYPAHARDQRLAREFWGDSGRRAQIPVHGDDAGFPYQYAALHDGVFVLSWFASYAEGPGEPDRYAWADSALASPAARDADLRLVLGHLPLYAVAQDRDRRGEVLAEPDRLREMLERRDVDAYLSGHHHAWYPGRRGGLDLLHAGALGQGARRLLGTDDPPMQTVTVIEVDRQTGEMVVRAYEVDADAAVPFREIDPATLPERIDGHNGFVVRRDLATGGER